MSVRHLDQLFRPRSVAVIGASDRPGSVGRAVFANLLDGGFKGTISAINPRHKTVAGRPAWRRLRDLPEVPELVVICTPPQTVIDLVREAGALGVRVALIITSGFAQAGEKLEVRLLAAAGEHGMRLLGPNSVGMILPHLGFNASFAPAGAEAGNVAFVTQSGALATAVLEWAAERDIGFSCFLSLGNCLDVDIGDVIDYLGSDPATGSILLYMESLNSGRKFMSAARAAARNKPLIIVKAGRVPEGARAAASHTGALAGSDEVYDAAIRRAGALRVFGIEDLFGMAEVLARARPLHGDRLAILTNGGGPGILATDALVQGGGRLARLSSATLERLDRLLPRNWSGDNPVDIIGDANAERYVEALRILLADDGVDAVLIVHAPTALAPGPAIAEALAATAAPANRPVFGCWLGGASARDASRVFARAGLPGFTSPEEAIAAFLRLQVYRSNQAALMETPDQIPTAGDPDSRAVRDVLAGAMAEQRRWLTEAEAKQVLQAYGIPVVETRVASDAEQAVQIAREIGFPVALKLLSPDITHKSDVGGVVLDLETPEAVSAAARAIAGRVARIDGARLSGFTVQAMARRPGAHELIVGASTDQVFGPVVLFGHGGTGVEVMQDTALGLTPLNMSLARQLIRQTRVARLLAGYRHRRPAREDLICDVLVRVSRLVTELDGIASLDINPLLADADGVIALDARIELQPSGTRRTPPAIAPYPRHLEERLTFDGQTLILRPIRPEDEPAHRDFFDSLNIEDVRFRFFGVVREPEHSQIARFTQIDYDREMAFIAAEVDGRQRTLGVARIASDPARHRAEFAVVVRSGMKGRGLGRLLLEKLIRYCREAGISTVVGQVLQDNQRMLALARDLGFVIASPEDGVHDISLHLQPRD